LTLIAYVGVFVAILKLLVIFAYFCLIKIEYDNGQSKYQMFTYSDTIC